MTKTIGVIGISKTWMVRPFPHDTDRLFEFKTDNIIAIGWPEVPSLKGKNKNEIEEILKAHPKKYSPRQLGIALATVNTFVNDMSIGDYIIIPYEEDIYFARVKSDYFFQPSKINEGYPHQRKIKFIKGPVSREELPDELRNSLRAPRTVTHISLHVGLIEKLLNDDDTPEETAPSLMEISYPLRVDLNSTIKIPRDITKDEALRLAEFIKTLYFN